MKALPLRWHGAARRERMRAALETLTRDWLSAWSDGLALECNLAQDAGMVDDSIWAKAEAPCGNLYAACTEQGLADLGCVLAGVPLAQGHPVASGIGRRALRDYLELVIASVGGHAAVKWDSTLYGISLDPRHGIAPFQLTVKGVDVMLYADDLLCDLLVPSERRAPSNLVPRLAAMKDEQIALEAILDLGKMDLADFKRLRPGEILKTQSRLDAQAQVRHRTSQSLATATLVRRDGRRALKFESKAQGMT